LYKVVAHRAVVLAAVGHQVAAAGVGEAQAVVVRVAAGELYNLRGVTGVFAAEVFF